MADKPEKNQTLPSIVGQQKSAKDQPSQKSEKKSKKARVSDDTQAIIDRLKAEGLLNRNSSPNSIRQVKIQLSKFDNVFQTISTSLIEQTSLLAKSLELTEIQDKEAAERRQAIDDVEDLTKPEKTKPKKTKPVLGDKLKSGAKAGFDFIKTFAKVAGGVFFSYNLIKGMVNKMTGGKFTEYETKFKDWIFKVSESLSSFSEIITNPLTWLVGSSVVVLGLRNNFKLLSGAIGIAAGLVKNMFAAGGSVLKALGLGKLTNTLPTAASPTTATPPIGAGKLPFGLKGSIVRGVGLASVATIVVDVAADMVRDNFEKNSINSAVKIGEAELNLVNLGETALKGAAIGAMFGPVGALVGAVGGAVYTLGGVAADYIKGEVEKSRSKLVADMDNNFYLVNTDLSLAKTEKEKREAILKARSELNKINDELLAQEEAALAKSKSTAGGRSNKGIIASGKAELERIEEQKVILEDSFNKLEQLASSVDDGTFIPEVSLVQEVRSVTTKQNRRTKMQVARLRRSIKRQTEGDNKLKTIDTVKENVGGGVTNVYNKLEGSTNIKEGDINSNSQSVLFGHGGGNSLDPNWAG
jgi:hypothetical protein